MYMYITLCVCVCVVYGEVDNGCRRGLVCAEYLNFDTLKDTFNQLEGAGGSLSEVVCME